MREHCCSCSIKHVGQAIVLLLESQYINLEPRKFAAMGLTEPMEQEPDIKKILEKCGPEHNLPKTYLSHRYLALAHLAEASDELMSAYPAEANMIKYYRKQMEDNKNYNAPLMDILNHLIELEE